MHPPLAAHKHQGCLEAIQALEECHQAGLFNRFSGACNDTKAKLDQCLKEEVSIYGSCTIRSIVMRSYSLSI